MSVSPKPTMMSSNVLFCPQPKYLQFTVIEEERNQKIFTFKKLESENFYILFPKNYFDKNRLTSALLAVF